MKKAAIVFMFILTVLMPLQCGALSYKGYIYDADNNVLSSQIGYQPREVKSLNETEAPSDFFVSDGSVYVLDEKQQKIYVYDMELSLQKEISVFTYQGNPVELIQPSGIYKRGDRLFLTDPEAQVVLRFDLNGNVDLKITAEDVKKAGGEETQAEFKPKKVITDETGLIYVVADGYFQGALTFTPEGEYSGFFGSNSVEVTFNLLDDLLWKKILSKEQISKMSKYVPEEFANFHIDDEGFVYTCTSNATTWKDRVKKLNPLGVNIIKENKGFGELENIVVNEQLISSQIIDITVDKNGFISILDYTRGRVYQYDNNGQLLMIFGGEGDQQGTFRKPAAIAQVDDEIWVLDAEKRSVTSFQLTDFGQAVHQAVMLYNDGRYEEAIDQWTNIHKLDKNYELAYVGIGKALYEQGSYKEAAQYFEQGNNRALNSAAFSEYRNQFIKKYSLWLLLGAVVLIVGIVLLLKQSKRVRLPANIGFVLHYARHPLDACDQLKYKHAGSIVISAVLVFLWFFVTVFERQFTDFRLNPEDPEKLNIFFILLRTVLLYIGWVFSDWAVCTLLEGKGKLREIIITTASALLPMMITMVISTVFSGLMTQEEGIFLSLLVFVGTAWSGILLFVGHMTVHQYEFGKAVWTLILSALGILAIVFIILLVGSIVSQFFGFVQDIFTELLYRL